ncbi:hypothetical protein ACET3Z_031433 [Daucus carota]
MNNSNLKISITASPLIDLDRFEQFWRTAKNKGTNEDSSVEFEIDGKEHILTVANINEAFGNTLADNESYRDLANDATLTRFFRKIGYAGPVLKEDLIDRYPTGEMDRKYLRKEWNMLFDAMVKIFSAKTFGWNAIPSYIRKPTHSMVHGYKVNVDKMIMAQLRSAIIRKPPIIFEILSSTHITSFVSSLTSRAEDRPNLSDVDLPIQAMEEPPSSGPQEPIAQIVMDTTPLNTEFNQGRIQSENETTTTLVTLPSATFPIKVAVTVSVAVKDSAGITAPLVVDSIPAVRVSLAVTSIPAGKVHTAVFTQTDSIVST